MASANKERVNFHMFHAGPAGARDLGSTPGSHIEAAFIDQRHKPLGAIDEPD